MDSISASCKETEPFPLKLFAKSVKNQVARQDSRDGGPEESRDAKHAYCLKASAAKVGWPCHSELDNGESSTMANHS